MQFTAKLQGFSMSASAGSLILKKKNCQELFKGNINHFVDSHRNISVSNESSLCIFCVETSQIFTVK